mmetsp:Transcript_35501/g.60868  ORF Transcript_35501/g.60868 Transcript_35501/m.60868 type:complete len:241 (-) Transcript_35501:141-863(-)
MPCRGLLYDQQTTRRWTCRCNLLCKLYRIAPGDAPFARRTLAPTPPHSANAPRGLDGEENGPEEGGDIVAERDPLGAEVAQHDAVADQVDERPVAQAGRPRLEEVLLDLGGPLLDAREQPGGGDERRAEEDARDRRAEEGLPEQGLAERRLDVEAGQEPSDHLEPVVQRGAEVEQAHERARERALCVESLRSGSDALSGDVGEREDSRGGARLCDDGARRQSCSVSSAQPTQAHVHSAST